MATGSLISEQEYLSTTYKPNCEYIDGVLRQKPMATEAHSAIQAELAYLVRARFSQFKPNTEFTLKIRTGKYYVPDLVVQRRDFIQSPYATAPVHLCVEIRSPEDRVSEVFQKCEEYHDWGVEMCWVIDPESRRAWEYRKGQLPTEVPAGGHLTAEGISIPLADVFAAL